MIAQLLTEKEINEEAKFWAKKLGSKGGKKRAKNLKSKDLTRIGKYGALVKYYNKHKISHDKRISYPQVCEGVLDLS